MPGAMTVEDLKEEREKCAKKWLKIKQERLNLKSILSSKLRTDEHLLKLSLYFMF